MYIISLYYHPNLTSQVFSPPYLIPYCISLFLQKTLFPETLMNLPITLQYTQDSFGAISPMQLLKINL